MKQWHKWIWILSIIPLVAFCGRLIGNEIPVNQWDWPEDQVEIPPYLLDLYPRSVTLCWVTPIENSSEIVLKSIYPAKKVTNPSPTRYHRVEFRELRPSTFYRYEINNLYEGEFLTPADDQSFRVAVVGHTHGTEPKLLYPEEFLIARIVELAPDFVIHCGDTTYHATIKEFRRFFFRLFAPVLKSSPVYVAAGNHDSGWPGVYGISFDNFKRLFPHHYPAKKGAYYSFVYKNAKFIALSYYTLGFGKNSRQYQWLAQELDKSTSEFNVVFLGGGQVPKTLIQELFDFLAEHRVDLVLGGDSSGAFLKIINGIPYFFTGTTFRQPHPLRLLEFSDYSLTLREFDATGKMGPKLHTINTQLPKTKALDLMDLRHHHAVFKKTRVESLNLKGFNSGENLTFNSLDLPANAFDGIFIKAKCHGSRPGALRVYWKSTEMAEQAQHFKHGNEQWDRLQPVELSTTKELEFIQAMPHLDTLNGRPYTLAGLRLVNASPGCEEGIELTDLFLFKDKD